ncbi:UNVERIFIED_CONTAM: hypothetical protein GTU68_036609 [Idotea baltica]|nr:hypothetical protein [Idotea baltica]
MKTEYLKTVEIWGKAAIASYLWEHILGGTKLVDPENPSIYLAQLSTPKCLLIYKEGPGLQMHNISMKADPLVLVLNGRTQEKVLESKKWLAFIKETRPLLKVVLFLLGNEKCNNIWLQEFLYPQGPVHGAFITYDVPTLDEKMTFQWPLGVATYRHFPLLFEKEVNPSQPRPYICNLQATNYMNSSRAPLFSFLKTSKLAKVQCIIKERKEWSASESPQSSGEYVDILLKSDITLCPSGFNTETYRVYEAMAAGSIPVIEDVPSKGSCDEASGWRLLKRFNPPVIWIKEWSKLKSILIKERKMSIKEKTERRKRLLNWYEWFKLRNSDRFTSFIHKLI